MKKFEFLEHPADIKIRSYGRDLPELFVNSALGMISFLYAKPERKTERTDKIRLKAPDVETLLVEWLSEILTLSDTNDLAYADYNLAELNEKEIIGEVGAKQAKAKDDIKAVTYSELEIRETKEGYEATVVYDI
ncbi:archease [Patescibacteria group bacterium]